MGQKLIFKMNREIWATHGNSFPNKYSNLEIRCEYGSIRRVVSYESKEGTELKHERKKTTKNI